MLIEIILGLIAFTIASRARIFYDGLIVWNLLIDMKKDLLRVRAKYTSCYD